ncbi:hypothetical protein [Arcanobacterium ihumii]|uniref:hypothetical protein n=1 Tax=Arcanobacterium ihumii TaxID=2138162 RepID=UPI000F53AA69|nr:hypothetical protein [Arcanobacterium ihumii]
MKNIKKLIALSVALMATFFAPSIATADTANNTADITAAQTNVDSTHWSPGMVKTNVSYLVQSIDEHTAIIYLDGGYFEAAGGNTNDVLIKENSGETISKAVGYASTKIISKTVLLVGDSQADLDKPQAVTRGFCAFGHNPNGSCRGGRFWKPAKCVIGTAGSGVLGGIAGTGVGATGWGVAGGAAVGIATFC